MREFVEKTFALIGMEIVWSGEGEKEVGTEKKTGIVRVRVDPKVGFALMRCVYSPILRVPGLPLGSLDPVGPVFCHLLHINHSVTCSSFTARRKWSTCTATLPRPRGSLAGTPALLLRSVQCAARHQRSYCGCRTWSRKWCRRTLS